MPCTARAEDLLVTCAAGKDAAAAVGPSLRRVDVEHEADARIEVWRYAADRRSSGGRVDALSLRLSLRETADERMRSALEDRLETV